MRPRKSNGLGAVGLLVIGAAASMIASLCAPPAAAARRWVLPPDDSTHVTGRAIDVGPRAGAAWLQTNGVRWGLCRTFDNEWWHFELVAVPGTRCPRPAPDAGRR